jgi:hypothetical protein
MGEALSIYREVFLQSRIRFPVLLQSVVQEQTMVQEQITVQEIIKE